MEFVTDYYSIKTENGISFLMFKGNVFSLITDVEESNSLVDKLDAINNDPKIIILAISNEPGCFDSKAYDSFINSILDPIADPEHCEPPCFCDRNTRFREINLLNKIIRSLANMQKLVIGGITGEVTTPFAGMYLFSDILFADTNTVISMAHNKYGLHPSGAIPFVLTKRLSFNKAMELLLEEKVNAKKLKKIHLIKEIIDAEDFMASFVTEVKKYATIKYCSLRDAKRLATFSRRELNDYFEYEASLLNL